MATKANTETVYAATTFKKRAERWTEDGVVNTNFHVIDYREINIRSGSLPELLRAIKEEFYEDGDYFCVFEDSVSFNRLEDDESNILTSEQEKDLLAKGENVWLCDYTFWIEKLAVSPIDRSEFEGLSGFTFDLH